MRPPFEPAPSAPTDPSDALVIFGITGDLAHKQIIPALYGLTKNGRLNMPVLGVARDSGKGGTLESRVRESLRDRLGDFDESVCASLCGRMRHVNGDYQDPETFRQLR